MDLKEYKNRKVKILITGSNNVELTYTGYVIEDTPTHFKFSDKYGDTLLFSKTRLLEVSLINGGGRQ